MSESFTNMSTLDSMCPQSGTARASFQNLGDRVRSINKAIPETFLQRRGSKSGHGKDRFVSFTDIQRGKQLMKEDRRNYKLNA